jgi:aspartate aminotransferase
MKFEPAIPIIPSATVSIHSLALKKRAAGERIYNLSAGEPVLPPSRILIDAADQAMGEGKTRYAPAAGIPELRQAVAEWMGNNYGTAYGPDNVIVTTGGKFGVYALCQAFVKPGIEAVIVAPYWPSYPDIVKLFGGTPVIVQTEQKNHWKIGPEALRQAITGQTKLLMLNSASNPTGTLYTREELCQILEIAREHNILVISDEVYSGLVYDDGKYISVGAFPEYSDNVVIIQSCSKNFAMTGWRVGFVLGPEAVIKILTMIQSQSTSGTATVSQWVALAAVQNTDKIMGQVFSAMEKRRDVLVAAFQESLKIKIVAPVSALYAFISLASLGPAEGDSLKFCEQLLDKGNVATVPGIAFGRDGFVRLSFGAPEQELREAVGAMARFMDMPHAI